MKISVTKVFTFEAAHKLPNHSGKCANLHGHSYQLEVTVTGKIAQDGSPNEGMIIDFAQLSKIVKREILNKFDHQYLNDVVDYVTTVENITVDIFKRLTQAGLNISKVKLWETRKAFAEIET